MDPTLENPIQAAPVRQKEKRSYPQCHFFIPRKLRRCKFNVARDGDRYCAHHQAQARGQDAKGKEDGSHKEDWGTQHGPTHRVLCIYCKTWIIRKKIEKHHSKCPALLREKERRAQPYYKENVNAGISNVIPKPIGLGEERGEAGQHFVSKSSSVTVEPDLTENEKTALVVVLKAICKDLDEIESDTGLCKECAPHAPSKPVGKAWKHFQQQSSILACLKSRGLFEDSKKVVLELGAGKGGLGTMASRAFGSDIVMVDYGSFRNTTDRYARQAGAKVCRIQMDLKHLLVERIPDLAGRSFVFCSKHLCGNATDFALRAVSRCLGPAKIVDGQDRKEEGTPLMEGLAIATCCHHRCTWGSYVGQKWLKELKIGERKFAQICRWASWATTVKSGKTKGAEAEEKRRLEVGRMCKRVLDRGRELYIDSLGLETTIVRYVDGGVTGEDKLLLGIRPR